MEDLPDSEANERCKSEPSEALHPLVGRYYLCLLTRGMVQVGNCWRTVRARETLLTFLEVPHLVHNFFHQTFQPSHLRFEA